MGFSLNEHLLGLWGILQSLVDLVTVSLQLTCGCPVKVWVQVRQRLDFHAVSFSRICHLGCPLEGS